MKIIYIYKSQYLSFVFIVMRMDSIVEGYH
jgi:hypothetical protein